MTDQIRFLLNGTPRALLSPSPKRTVLDYLRHDEGLTGLKEGCGAGSCGACTVVVAEVAGDRLRWRPLTACLLPVTALHGKLLLTVEGLTDTDGDLHPAQQAMVDHKASGCGFCSPGATMSLVALGFGSSRQAAPRDAAVEALSGNLCRCTGYQPMIDAGIACCRAPNDRFAAAETEIVARLQALVEGPDPAFESDGLRYFGPRSVKALRDLLGRHPEARIACGGTASAPGGAADAPPVLIAIGDVAELRQMSVDADGVRIGTAAPYADVSPAIADAYPGLADLIDRIGSLQTRHRGSFGGALSFPAPSGDVVPAVMALDAVIVLLSVAGERLVPAEAFVAGQAKAARRPGEIIARIDLPPPSADHLFAAYKISKRHDMSFAAVGAAFALILRKGVIEEARAAYIGLGLGATRVAAVEEALIGRPWTAETAAAAAAALPPDLPVRDDIHGSAAYRRRVAGNLLRRFQLETTQPAVPAEVVAL